MGNCTSSKNNDKYPYKLLVKTSIWSKNQHHNLFDFESNSLKNKEFILEKQGRVVQVDNQVFPIGYYEYVKNQQEIFKLNIGQDKANIKQSHPMNLNITNQENNGNDTNTKQDTEQNQLWYVVRDQKVNDSDSLPQDKKYKLQVGDIIKLGRANLRVKDFVLVTDSKDNNDNEDNPPHTEENDSECSFNNEEKHRCRICLGQSSGIDNPLLSPCICAGSMKYIHLKCIQKWVEKQMKTKKYNAYSVYFWKRLRCELCKDQYKTEFQYQDRVYNIIDIPKPKHSYLMLYLKSADKKQERGIYVIDLSKKQQIKIGRTQECDIKLNDISVSRIHAILQMEKNQLFIEDCGSKFGTLILLQNGIDICPKEKKKYQLSCGRTLVTLEWSKKNRPAQGDSKINLVPENIVVEQMNQEQIIQYEKDPQFEKKNQNNNGHLVKVFQDSVCIENQKEQKGKIIENDGTGKMGIELDDIIIYGLDEKTQNININDQNQAQQSNIQLQADIMTNHQNC